MDIEKLAREAGATTITSNGTAETPPRLSQVIFSADELRRFTTIAMQECARICEEVRDSAPNHVDWDSWLDSADKCADMIRAQVPPQSEASDK